MGIYKSGIIKMGSFEESESNNLIYLKSDNSQIVGNNYSMSYTPAKDTNNSCIDLIYGNFNSSNITTSTLFRIRLNVSWNGFDDSSTAGTFNIYFQGARREKASGNWVWTGDNVIPTALNNQKSLKTLVLSATKGTYIYDTTFSLPSSFIETYDAQCIGIRTNYSNGVGKIEVSDILLIEDRYSSSTSSKAHIGEDFMSGREFIEI